MLEVILPVTSVLAAIGKFKDALTVLKVVPELAVVGAPVWVGKLAGAGAFAIVPATVVLALIRPLILAGAVTDVLVEVTLVRGTVRPGHDPKMIDELLENKVEVQGKKPEVVYRCQISIAHVS